MPLGKACLVPSSMTGQWLLACAGSLQPWKNL
jgi:hypothetical protein